MRSRRLVRCPGCGLHVPMCMCADLPRLTPRTRVLLIAHRAELRKTTNTAKLGALMLAGAELITNDEQSEEFTLQGAWLLFPGEDSVSLEEAARLGITRLVVPDGTWPQARRIARRHVHCAGLPTVRIDPLHESRYALRRNLRPGGLCTLEALAECMRVLESEAMAETMLASFHEWVDRSSRIRRGDHTQGRALDDYLLS